MYEYLVTVGGCEQKVKFFADSEPAARIKAEEWVGENGAVLEFVGKWAVQN